MKYTITAFKKLTAAKIKESLPLEVTSSGKTLFNATLQAPVATNAITNDQLVDLVLKARGDGRGDASHVAFAQSIVDSVFPKIAVPTNPTAPTVPATTSASDITKPYWIGNWSGNPKDAITGIAKENAGKTLLLVAYNIPNRDNGSYSAGGVADSKDYIEWTQGIVDGIGKNKAIVILEPDALGLSRSLSNEAKESRYALFNDAIKRYKTNPNTKVYVDSSTWAGVDDSIALLKKLKGMDGFSCNVSGYDAQDGVAKYADAVSKGTGLHYVCDTSRNGNGNPFPGKWCNVILTKVGFSETLNPTPLCDAYLHLKIFDESDGNDINGDGTGWRADVPNAGEKFTDFGDAISTGDWAAFRKKYNV